MVFGVRPAICPGLPRIIKKEDMFMQHLRRMEDRVVLLTGGGGGIARGVARAFADEGASMILA